MRLSNILRLIQAKYCIISSGGKAQAINQWLNILSGSLVMEKLMNATKTSQNRQSK